MAGQAQWEVNLQVSNNLQELYALAEKLQGQLNSMENSKHEIKLNINEDELNKAIKNLNKMLDSIGKGTKNFTQFENLSKDIQEAISSVKLLGSAFGKIDKDTGMSEMLTTIKNIDTSLSSLVGNFNKVKSGLSGVGDEVKGLENATRAVEKLESAKIIDIFPDDSDFESILKKLDLTKSKLSDIQKITMKTDIVKDDKGHEKPLTSYTLKDSRGSSEIYGESSHKQMGQMLRQNYVAYDSKEAEKEQKAQERAQDKSRKYALKTARENIANYKKHAKELNRLKSAQVTSKDTKSYDEQIKIEEKELEAASTAMQKSMQRTSSFYNQNPLPIEQWREYNDVMKSHKQAVDEVVLSEAKLKDSIATSNSSVLSNMEESIKKDLSGIDKYRINASEHNTVYKDKIDAYSEAVFAKQAYKKQLEEKVKGGELITTEDIQNFEKYTDAVDKAKVAVTSFKSAEKGSSEWSRDKLRLKIAQTLNEYSGMSTNMKNELNILDQKLSTLGANANVSQLGSEFTKLQREIITTGQATQSFFDVVKEKAYYGIASGIGTYFGFDDFINQLKEGFNVIRELDTAFTEMKKVSNESDLSLKNYQKTTFDTADEVGTTAKTIQDSTATWMRLGESMDQAAESAKTSNILLNVSEFEDIDSATESLVAVSQAYKDLDKMDIVNRLNQIGNDFSISTDGLATALQDSASSLLTSGNDIDEAISLITAGNAVTQDPAKVGAGMRTISLRLVGTEAAKKELSDLGEDTDDFITSQSKLRDVIMQATAAASKDGKGFDILDSNGNYKSTFEIMSGLADLYDDIVAKDKELGTNNLNLLLETIAGEFLAWECRKYILRTYLIARATSIGQSYHVI